MALSERGSVVRWLLDWGDGDPRFLVRDDLVLAFRLLFVDDDGSELALGDLGRGVERRVGAGPPWDCAVAAVTAGDADGGAEGAERAEPAAAAEAAEAVEAVVMTGQLAVSKHCAPRTSVHIIAPP